MIIPANPNSLDSGEGRIHRAYSLCLLHRRYLLGKAGGQCRLWRLTSSTCFRRLQRCLLRIKRNMCERRHVAGGGASADTFGWSGSWVHATAGGLAAAVSILSLYCTSMRSVLQVAGSSHEVLWALDKNPRVDLPGCHGSTHR